MEETPVAVFRTASLGPVEAVRLYEHEVEVARAGILRRSTQRVRYEQIAQVAVNRGLLSTTLTIESTGGDTMSVEGMSRITAEEARAAIQERVEIARVTARGTESTGAPPIATQIRELAELKKAGIITEEEFQTKKRDLLERM
jgi:hypothetical protein